MTPDVVFVIAPTVQRDEFQYALRSLQFVDHGTVWIVGHKPDWVVNVEHVPFSGGNKWRALNDVWHVFKNTAGIADLFYYSEDDYFITRKVDGLIPNYYLDTLEERVLRADAENARGGWSNSLRDTLRVLQAAGVKHPISFDVHIPMLVEKAQIPVHLDDGSRPLRFRSLVGNLSDRPPRKVASDVKTVTESEFRRVQALDVGFQSSNEATFESSGVATFLRSLFPNKSVYER